MGFSFRNTSRPLEGKTPALKRYNPGLFPARFGCLDPFDPPSSCVTGLHDYYVYPGGIVSESADVTPAEI